jgi:hypothetical protein
MNKVQHTVTTVLLRSFLNGMGTLPIERSCDFDSTTGLSLFEHTSLMTSVRYGCCQSESCYLYCSCRFVMVLGWPRYRFFGLKLIVPISAVDFAAKVSSRIGLRDEKRYGLIYLGATPPKIQFSV